MAVKAKLKVVLLANEVVIAESDDAGFWQEALRALSTGTPMSKPKGQQTNEDSLDRVPEFQRSGHHVASFSKWLGISSDEVRGACAPSMDPPFLQLDERYWETFRSGLPARGPTAIGPMQLAGTLLALWFRHAKLGNPSQAQGQAVLDTIGLRDKNPSRAIRNCEWLQPRNGGFQLNPAMISRAMDVARAYCTRATLRGSTDGDIK